MTSFHTRKKERTYRFYMYKWRVKQKTCTACNGSGKFDSTKHPDCSACDGTGKEEYRTPFEEQTVKIIINNLINK